jgi:hypothetical protein
LGRAGRAGYGAAGEFCSLQLISGKPAIAHRFGNHGLKYTESSSLDGALFGAWSAPQVVDGNTGPFVGQYLSMVELAGKPAISYYDETNDDLKFAFRQ